MGLSLKVSICHESGDSIIHEQRVDGIPAEQTPIFVEGLRDHLSKYLQLRRAASSSTLDKFVKSTKTSPPSCAERRRWRYEKFLEDLHSRTSSEYAESLKSKLVMWKIGSVGQSTRDALLSKLQNDFLVRDPATVQCDNRPESSDVHHATFYEMTPEAAERLRRSLLDGLIIQLTVPADLTYPPFISVSSHLGEELVSSGLVIPT